MEGGKLQKKNKDLHKKILGIKRMYIYIKGEYIMSLTWEMSNKKIMVTKSEGEDIVKEINEAIDSLVDDNWYMIIEGETYECNGGTIEITHPITIVSSNRDKTILNNGNIVISSSNVEIQGLTIKATDLDNAIKTKVVKRMNGKVNEIKNITIKNCYAEARDHAYLFEAYGVNVSDIKVEGCEAKAIKTYNEKKPGTDRMSYHGFISKVKNVSFIDCKARGFGSYGFGIISENDPKNEKNTVITLAENNLIKNCEARDCAYALNMYCRVEKDRVSNMTEKELEKILYSRNHIITNFMAKNCIYTLVVGSIQSENEKETKQSNSTKETNQENQNQDPPEKEYMYCPIEYCAFDGIKIIKVSPMLTPESEHHKRKRMILVHNIRNCKFNNIRVE